MEIDDGETMKHEIRTQISYILFSESTTNLKAKGRSNFLIFEPYVRKTVSFPYKFSFYLTVGIMTPKTEIEDLYIKVFDPMMKELTQIPLGKMIEDQYSVPSDLVFTGNFSLYTEKGIDIEMPGLITIVVFYQDTPLAESRILFDEVEDNE
ncbi:hypothetical protein LWE69_20020 [Paenibacillus sp. UKAQ_18]|nr:hypothetical protein [Paenibacillus sp. UKAQ_18]